MNKYILALDLGSTTGWARGTVSNMVSTEHDHGAVELVRPKVLKEMRKTVNGLRAMDPRVPALWEWLNTSPVFNAIWFEDVQFSTYTLQVQLWSSLRAVVWLYAHKTGAAVNCIGVGTLKKFATGSGNADKAQMLAAAQKAGWARPGKNDDNEVDARWLLRYAFATK